MGRWNGALAGVTAGLTVLLAAISVAGLGPVLPSLSPILLLAAVLVCTGVASVPGVTVIACAQPRRQRTALVAGVLILLFVDAMARHWQRAPSAFLIVSALLSEWLVLGIILSSTPASIQGRARATGRWLVTQLHHRPMAMQPNVLDVIVMAHCGSCARSRELASFVAGTHPDLVVRVVDLGDPGILPPPGLVAIPAYVLNGQIIFTGNPSSDMLVAALRRVPDRS